MADVIGAKERCNTLANKKQKVFRASITPFDYMRRIFVDYQGVRCGVIPLKVLHQFS